MDLVGFSLFVSSSVCCRRANWIAGAPVSMDCAGGDRRTGTFFSLIRRIKRFFTGGCGARDASMVFAAVM